MTKSYNYWSLRYRIVMKINELLKSNMKLKPEISKKATQYKRLCEALSAEAT